MDINSDGKMKYVDALTKKLEPTSTILVPKSSSTPAFDQCSQNKKGYRANSESQTIYKEKTRDKKSLINFQTQPFNILSMRDIAQEINSRRPATTIL